MSTYEQSKANERIMSGEGFVLPYAWQRYAIVTCYEEDAVVTVEVETNDDNDDGYPDGEITRWSLTFPSVDAALRYTGKCRVGVSGVIVIVSLDGEEIR